MDRPTGSFLGGCLQTVCRSDSACLGYLRPFFFFFLKYKDEKLGGVVCRGTLVFALSCSSGLCFFLSAVLKGLLRKLRVRS